MTGDRILTTHAGSLPRPPELVALHARRFAGERIDATELAQHCDLFLAIGSSLVVWPAAGFPMMAKHCGAKLVIINNEPTEQDDIADLVIRHDIGETLGPFVGN